MPGVEAILDCSMGANDSGASTVRGYLIELLLKLWQQEEDFSSKRAFGNSGWQWDVYLALVANGVVPGVIDMYGDVTSFDRAATDDLIQLAILSLSPDSSQ